jgi:hypothetical protein
MVQRLGGSEVAREAREGSVTSLGRVSATALRELRESSAKRDIREGSAKREVREGSAKREMREGSVASSTELGEGEGEERLGGQLIKTGSLSSLGTRYKEIWYLNFRLWVGIKYGWQLGKLYSLPKFRICTPGFGLPLFVVGKNNVLIF